MAFDYRQLQELHDALTRHGVAYLVIGKSGALLHGFPDTTQNTNIFVHKAAANGRALVNALRELRFPLDDRQAQEIERGKDFIQLRSGPFDMDIVFAPDGIETFDDAWSRGVEIDGIPVCSLDDIIESKRAANRPRDRESLPRLEGFRQYQRERTVRHKVLQAPSEGESATPAQNAALPADTSADAQRQVRHPPAVARAVP